MEVNILDLHFDILICICQQLETFCDKKNFARSHPKLWNVFAYVNRNDVQSVVNFEDNEEEIINHWDFILEWWGSSVIKIYNKYNYIDSGDLLEIAAKFCPNLEFITLVIKEGNIKRVEENLPKLKQLTDIRMRIDFLRLRKNNYTSEVDVAYLIELMQSLTNLRHLNFGAHTLKKNERIQLNKLIQLRELKIGPVQTGDVDDLSTLLGHLRVLIIEYYPDTDTLRRLAEHCTKLERLSLEDYNNRSFHEAFYSMWRIAYFPKLTYLHIFKGSCRNPFLCHLDSRYNDQLQVLNIPCLTMGEKEIARVADLRALKELFCMDIEPTSIDTLIKMQLEHISYWESRSLFKFHILRLINESSSLKALRCACRDFDKELLSNLLDVLEEKGFQPDHPFQLTNTNYFDIQINNELMIEFPSMPKSNLMSLKLMPKSNLMSLKFNH